ncbi:hypothetical protein QBC38DRAFT_230047 [Podospora fimiseda]|uniref:CENP-V/GFA domain-containing protein n=1 Tax=Podospora fimiseda TaxID=252190 RepID=A0AAN7BN75_9PEZI|nr:hypothetical protein QBC38DRAFT_230047 [Podospora fimiseda]
MEEETNPQTIRISAQCLCKTHTYIKDDFVIPHDSSEPIKAITCHCDSCRHITGALTGSRAILWSDNEESDWMFDSSHNWGPRRYTISNHMTLLFCWKCSSPLFVVDTSSEETQKIRYWVCSGVLGKEMTRLKVDWGTHVYVGNTKDGGGVNWFSGDSGGKKWLGKGGMSEEVKGYWPPLEAQKKKVEEEEVEEEVRLKCHCGGVNLVVKAGEAKREFEKQASEGKELPWFVDPRNHKSLGVFDGCDSCRLQSGVEIFNWTFFLLKHIGFADGKEGFPLTTAELKAAVQEAERDGPNEDEKFGTLAWYASSDDVQRYFCSRCAACVFYCVDDRPDIADVAVGLLDAKDGARAESIISWEFGGKIGWREDMGMSWRENLLYMVEKEVEEWREKRGYPKGWRRIVGEEKAAKEGKSE